MASETKKVKYPGIPVAMDGNSAVIMCERESTDAAGAYPITPSTEMGENYQLAFAEGKLDAAKAAGRNRVLRFEGVQIGDAPDDDTVRGSVLAVALPGRDETAAGEAGDRGELLVVCRCRVERQLRTGGNTGGRELPAADLPVPVQQGVEQQRRRPLDPPVPAPGKHGWQLSFPLLFRDGPHQAPGRR